MIEDIENNGIDLATAKSINEQTDGYLFTQIPMNSYTAYRSTQNVNKTIKVLKEYSFSMKITLTPEECQVLARELNAKRKVILEAIEAPISTEKYEKAITNTINDKVISDLSLSEVVDNHDELCELFGSNVSDIRIAGSVEQYPGISNDIKFKECFDKESLNSYLEKYDDCIGILKSITIENLVINYQTRLYNDLTLVKNTILPDAVEYCTELMKGTK